MKKFVSLIFAIAVATAISVHAEPMDYAAMSTEDLVRVEQEIKAELAKRGKAQILPQGRYLAGRDIGFGIYTITAHTSDDGDSCWWTVANEYECGGVHAYYEAYDKYRAGQTDTEPSRLDYYWYYNLYRERDQITITLEEGNCLQIDKTYTDDSFLTIEKVDPLFMDP